MVSDRSNGIYRSVIAALVGLILIGAAELPKKDAQPEQAKEQREIADTLKDIAASLKEAQKPDQSTQPCDPKKPNRNSDLCAQWKAADAATDAAEAAWRQILIGWIGVVLGAITMAAAIAAAIFAKKAAEASEENARAAIDAVAATNKANLLAMKANARATRQAVAGAAETAKALDIAERNSKAVQRQVEISEETSRKQLRAYLAATEAIVTLDITSKEVRDAVIFRIENTGKTPANLTSYGFEAHWLYGGEITEISKIDRKLDISIPERGKATIPFPLGETPLSLAIAEKDRGGFLMLLMEIEYIDVFEKMGSLKATFITMPDFWNCYPEPHVCGAFSEWNRIE